MVILINSYSSPVRPIEIIPTLLLIPAILDKKKEDAAKNGCEREHYRVAGMVEREHYQGAGMVEREHGRTGGG